MFNSWGIKITDVCTRIASTRIASFVSAQLAQKDQLAQLTKFTTPCQVSELFCNQSKAGMSIALRKRAKCIVLRYFAQYELNLTFSLYQWKFYSQKQRKMHKIKEFAAQNSAKLADSWRAKTEHRMHKKFWLQIRQIRRTLKWSEGDHSDIRIFGQFG